MNFLSSSPTQNRLATALATAQKGIRHAQDCHLGTMGVCTCPHDKAMEAMAELRNILTSAGILTP